MPVPVGLKKVSSAVDNNVIKKTVYNESVKKVNGPGAIKSKMLEVICMILRDKLATAAGLTAVENKIPNVIDLLGKADFDENIRGIERRCFTTSDYNMFTNIILDAKITEKKLASELINPVF